MGQDLSDILRRIEKLEQRVFGVSQADDKGRQETSTRNSPELDFARLSMEINSMLKSRARKLEEEDMLIFQIVQSRDSTSISANNLFTLCNEEEDEDVALLCSVLASKQRVGILRLLTLQGLSSGELAEAMHMAGGHLHHHLRDLLKIDLVEKGDDSKYSATSKGIAAYATVALLYRKLSWNNRDDFWKAEF